ncbi:response regulator [Thiorhodococcus minor]|uniref:histidine kinase n=1 Tax=Thiorhodococcus minor TaxID=57489 RepID=A0A6M0K3L9_9GAMM|nr:response regulator [Thiorhodococcus minor]
MNILDLDDEWGGSPKGRIAAETPVGEALRLACDMVWDWDLTPGGVMLCRCFGTELPRCLGAATRELGSDWCLRIHPDDLAAREALIARCIQGSMTAFSADYRARCNEAGWRWLLELGIVRAGEAGAITRLSGLAVDVTESAFSSPLALASAAGGNPQRIADASRDSAAGLHALATALLPELRSPLSPMRNALELLQDMGANEATLGAARDIIDRRLAEIAQLFRRSPHPAPYPAPLQGDACAQWAAVDLEQTLRQALEAVCPKALQDDWISARDRASGRLSVKGDSVQLSQAFASLIGTLGEGTLDQVGVDIGIEGSESEILVSLSLSDGDRAPEPLPDTIGLGASPAGQKRSAAAFDAELLLPRRLVALHGGRVDSSPGSPADRREVRVWLPRLLQNVDCRSVETIASSAEAEGRRRVLVADDNDEVVDSLALLLDLRGYEVKAAQNGLEAVRIAESWQPDVILLDIGMPGLDGYEACQRIRAIRPDGDLRIFALTGWAGGDDVAGFDGYLLKPVEADVLVRRIEEATRSLRDG